VAIIGSFIVSFQRTSLFCFFFKNSRQQFHIPQITIAHQKHYHFYFLGSIDFLRSLMTSLQELKNLSTWFEVAGVYRAS
jgi:hypothetical protein